MSTNRHNQEAYHRQRNASIKPLEGVKIFHAFIEYITNNGVTRSVAVFEFIGDRQNMHVHIYMHMDEGVTYNEMKDLLARPLTNLLGQTERQIAWQLEINKGRLCLKAYNNPVSPVKYIRKDWGTLGSPIFIYENDPKAKGILSNLVTMKDKLKRIAQNHRVSTVDGSATNRAIYNWLEDMVITHGKKAEVIIDMFWKDLPEELKTLQIQNPRRFKAEMLGVASLIKSPTKKPHWEKLMSIDCEGYPAPVNLIQLLSFQGIAPMFIRIFNS